MEKLSRKDLVKVIDNESGRIGYIIAWFLGVPTSLLFLIFLVRGH
jgi:hypothetical protein